jgi:hypothetical protein
MAPFVPMGRRTVTASLAASPSTGSRRRTAGAHARGVALFVLAIGVVSASCKTAGVRHAYTALDQQGARKRTQFFTDTQSIWCDVEYSSGRADVTIDTRIRATQVWDDALQTLVPVDATIATGEIAGMVGMASVAGFQWVITLPGGGAAPAGTIPYPVGDFVCDVTLDGEAVASLPFSVEFPTCPVPPVLAGASCDGWVREGSVCPDPSGFACICTGGAWRC